MKIKVTALFSVIILLLSLCACTGDETQSSDAEQQSTTVITSQKELSIAEVSFKSMNTKDLDGNSVDKSIFKENKLTVVNIWATFCSPCIGEMPSLGELSKQYKDKGVGFIGIVGDAANSDGTINEELFSDAVSIVKNSGADYVHLIADSALNDILNSIIGYPTTFFVDSEGNIIGNHIVGARSKSEWERTIDQMLLKVQ